MYTETKIKDNDFRSVRIDAQIMLPEFSPLEIARIEPSVRLRTNGWTRSTTKYDGSTFARIVVDRSQDKTKAQFCDADCADLQRESKDVAFKPSAFACVAHSRDVSRSLPETFLADEVTARKQVSHTVSERTSKQISERGHPGTFAEFCDRDEADSEGFLDRHVEGSHSCALQKHDREEI